jgi:hypothetical protein
LETHATFIGFLGDEVVTWRATARIFCSDIDLVEILMNHWNGASEASYEEQTS